MRFLAGLPDLLPLHGEEAVWTPLTLVQVETLRVQVLGQPYEHVVERVRGPDLSPQPQLHPLREQEELVQLLKSSMSREPKVVPWVQWPCF